MGHILGSLTATTDCRLETYRLQTKDYRPQNREKQRRRKQIRDRNLFLAAECPYGAGGYIYTHMATYPHPMS